MITLLKLSSGAEVVGKREIETNEYVVLNRPLQINYKYYVNATPSIWFVRYSMFGESDSIMFDKRHIINQSIARDKFVDFYNQNADFHFNELEQHIDSELTAAVQNEMTPRAKTSEEELKKFLESLSIEGSQPN